MPLQSVELHTRETVKTLVGYMIAQGKSDYLGERVTQLEHSLQCAHLARKDPVYGQDDEIVIAALLHDVGRFIPAAQKMDKMYAADGEYLGRMSHDVVGEYYLRTIGFSDKVAELVGAHVMAKRYLTATDKDYYDWLSEASKRTLGYQGGPFNEAQVREVQKDPLLEAKLAVRRWDDLAKVPNIEVPDLSAYEETIYHCLLESRTQFTLHSRQYNLPIQPTVVICIDGFDPEYLESGILPTFNHFVENGFHATAKSCMPSFTNPNNVSIITGAPPSIGIAGNFFLDRETGKETMITDSLLRGSTILEQMSCRGVRVAAVTHKDKLRKILAHGLKGAICFSAECARDCTLEENGIENVEEWIGRQAPSQYSGDLSLFVLDAGIKLLEEGKSDFLYLTLSDYIQHKYPPGPDEADEFMGAIDARLQKLASLAPIVGVTGDHGMSRKSNADGEPNVLFLEDKLHEKFGARSARVICPITDPFVRHHGALGSFVRVYLKDLTTLGSTLAYCKSLPEIEVAITGKEAAEIYNMPLDREGDIVVVSKPEAVIGTRKSEHDLSKVRDYTLRSHGGLSEQDIPIIMNKRFSNEARAASAARTWRNFDVFDLTLNWSRW
ncbi:conserved hypothetical protein [Talaromyces stipitatus ATCC 10500]|uniref:HD domain-containing protein n=1 Tax=Talaromyces stipitatus (strain ATCC 10500 / CBS 375.48 / QM 6759 / NRRL 1006) TaxID=441959 RepID=B8MDJ2_TALSN|nr:uncharacterized protein TSTA_117400 [Talaromyces stipitatus ATCC 10500]EED17955.1 conserved hypothetical protein [Talaromyces stipitatus ATCC 10500]